METKIEDLKAGDRFELYPNGPVYTLSHLIPGDPKETQMVVEEVLPNSAHRSMMHRWTQDTVMVVGSK